jgi:hypothetical protein
MIRKHQNKSLNTKQIKIKKFTSFWNMPFWDKVIYVLFVVCMGLIYWEIMLYRRTIIDYKILLCIFLIPGFITTPLLYDILNRFDGIKMHWFWHYILHTVIVGGFLMFSFMSINFYGANSNPKIETFAIIKKGSLPGRKYHRNERVPYAEINYNGFNKQLVFGHKYEIQMDTAKLVTLYIRDGRFGFKILDRLELK